MSAQICQSMRFFLRFRLSTIFRKASFSLILVCIFSSAVAAQNNKALAQVSSGPIVVGQRFDLVIRLPDLGFSAPQASFPNLSSKLTFVSGPDISYDVGLDENGRRSRYVFMRFVFRANAPGYIEFPPVPVQMGSQTYTTDSVLAGIAPQDDPRNVPPELFWDIPANQVFEGQALFVNLSLRYVSAIGFPDKVELSQVQGGIFEEAAGLGRIDTETIAGNQFQRVPVATYIFTPSIRGVLSLPAAKVALGKLVLTTTPRQLTVMPLPPELAATGAIGDLSFSPILSSQRIGQDEQVTLTMRVEGEGNLNFLRIPEPEAKQLIMLGKSENSRYVPSEHGYKGFREIVYRFGASGPGSASISIPAFANMKIDGTTETAPSRDLAVIIDRASTTGQVKQSRLPVLSMEQIVSMRPWYLHETVFAFLLFLPGLIFLLTGIGLSISRRKKTPTVLAVFLVLALLPQDSPAADETTGWKSLVESGNSAYDAGDFQKAFDEYEQALSLDPKNPGIMYNLALASFEKGSTASGVYYAQHALRLVPDNDMLRNGLESWETRLGLDRQHDVVKMPGSDVLLIVLAFCWTLAGFVLFVSRGRLRSFGVIVLVLVFFGLSGSLGIFIYDLNQTRVPLGVVAEQGALLRRIPDAAADEWLNLPSGTSVIVSVRSGSFYLVETAYGIKGWLDRSAIFFDQSRLKL